MYYIIASGKKKSKLGENALERACAYLNKLNVEFTVLFSEYAGHSIELAKEASLKEDCKAIIALGGDGTFFEVLNGIDTKRIPIGLIPCGTGNDFARSLGITTSVEECIDNILNNEPEYVDYLKIGDKKAFNVIGTGFDIQLLEKEIEIRAKKNTNDKSSYNKALINTIFNIKFHKMKYRIDDGEEQSDEYFMVDCCNGIWGGGMLPLCINADVKDGYMDFTYIKKFPKFMVLPMLLIFKSGKLEKTKYVKHVKCKKLELSIDCDMKVNLDGEMFNLLPNTIEVVHNELRYFPSSKAPVDPLYILKHKHQFE